MKIYELPNIKELLNNKYCLYALGYYNGTSLDFFPAEIKNTDSDIYDYTYLLLIKDSVFYKFSIIENYSLKKDNYIFSLDKLETLYPEELTFLRAIKTSDVFINDESLSYLFSGLQGFIKFHKMNLVLDKSTKDRIIKDLNIFL